MLDFTMLRPVVAWRAFWNLGTVFLFNFPPPPQKKKKISCRSKPRIANQCIRGHDCTPRTHHTATVHAYDCTPPCCRCLNFFFLLQKPEIRLCSIGLRRATEQTAECRETVQCTWYTARVHTLQQAALYRDSYKVNLTKIQTVIRLSASNNRL
jgi:hypothetical protein